MALKIEALKQANEKIKEGGESTPLFVRQKDLKDATPFRLSPSLPSMGGMPYLRVVQWWFENKKAVISLETFGKACPIQEEINEAAQGEDADIAALAGNEDRIKRSETYWFPGWLLNYKMEGNDVVGIGIVDKAPKILQAGPQLTGHINDIILSRIVQKIKTEDSIADRVEGYNIMLTRKKTGSGTRDVEYKAVLDEQWEVPAKYFQEAIDPAEVAKSMCPNKSYQRALIRELLYGEEIPAAVQAKEDARKEEIKEAFKEKMAEREAAKKSATAPAKKASAVSPEEDSDDDEPKAAAKKSAPVKSTKKVVDEDEDDDNKLPFDEDEPKTAAKKVATKKSVVPLDDEDDDAPKAAAKKAVAPKKKAADIDDDEFED